MKKQNLVLLSGMLLAPLAFAAAPGDVTAPIRQFIDGFNTGDTDSAFAAYATGDITIVDEFAPHRWVGPHAAQDWAADYDTHASATGVTGGKVTYGKPTRTEIEGDVAYVVMPTAYLYKEHGKPMAEEGQITVVLHSEAGAWKMSGWTWSGVKPHPAN
jgi:SnoaL-like domain